MSGKRREKEGKARRMCESEESIGEGRHQRRGEAGYGTEWMWRWMLCKKMDKKMVVTVIELLVTSGWRWR